MDQQIAIWPVGLQSVPSLQAVWSLEVLTGLGATGQMVREEGGGWPGALSKEQAALGSGPCAIVARATVNTEQGSAWPATITTEQKGDWRKRSEMSGSGLREQCESSFFSLWSLKKPKWYWPALVKKAEDVTLTCVGLLEWFRVFTWWGCERSTRLGIRRSGLWDCCLLSTHRGSSTLCIFSLILQILQAALQNREHCDYLFKVKVTELISGKAGIRTHVSRIPEGSSFPWRPLLLWPMLGPSLCSYRTCCVTLDRSLPPSNKRARDEISGPAWCNLSVPWSCNWDIHMLRFYNSKGLWTLASNIELGIGDVSSSDRLWQQCWEWTWQPCRKECVLILLGRAFCRK